MLVAAVVSVQADQAIQSVQQALKDQGFYYGEITGEKDADTTAAIRRYQIRNGLQITGDLNDETVKSLGVDSSGARAVVKASPTAAPSAPTQPDTSDLRDDRPQGAAPTNPLTGQPFPDQSQDRQPPVAPDYGAVPAHPAENFAGTPFEGAAPQMQRDVIASAQNILARQGLYRGMVNGTAGPELEFSLRAYQPHCSFCPARTRRSIGHDGIPREMSRSAVNGFRSADHSGPAISILSNRNGPIVIRQRRCRQKSAPRCGVESGFRHRRSRLSRAETSGAAPIPSFFRHV